MDANKEKVIEKIYRLTLQDAEFDTALRKKLGIVSPADVILGDNERINEIYELCIEKITRKQGTEFYADFPIESLRSALAYDYNRMERFRRKDDFGDFCLAMYQQIENITNYICADPIVNRVASKMWAYPAYCIDSDLKKRPGEYIIARLLFIGNTGGNPNYLIKTSKPLSEHYAWDKMRNVVYFIGYKAEMKSSDYDSFNEICSLLSELYQCRNTNHRHTGLSETSEHSRQILEKIRPLKSFYYSKFHGLLSQYVEYVKNGYPLEDKLIDYADSLPDIDIKPQISINIKGKIDLDKIPKR